MKKKNGFTLIELLAVIVILAIIALIAVPIIMNVINEAKKGAAKDSMYGYVEAIELEVAKSILTNQNLLTGDYTTKTGDLYSGSTKVLSVSFKGNRPEDGGTVTLTNGSVTKAELTFGGHAVTYNGKVDGGAPTPTTIPTLTTGTIGDQVKVKGITGTFHLIKPVSESDTMALLIYDDKVGTSGPFSSDGSNVFSGSLAEQQLKENTKTWQSDITNAGGNVSGLVISIPSKEEIQTVRSFYGVTGDGYQDKDSIESSRGEWFYLCICCIPS